MSVYANAYARDDETSVKSYIKHTMTKQSAFDIENYSDYADKAFQPVVYKNHRIGLTICYDCNHPLFSRKYTLNGADIIINSTGSNVVYDKWYKYNKVRAVENECFNFVTMGGESSKNNNYVFGFSPSGKELQPVLLNGNRVNENNLSGQIYVYDTADYDGSSETDNSFDQIETANKNSDFSVPMYGFDAFIGALTGMHINKKRWYYSIAVPVILLVQIAMLFLMSGCGTETGYNQISQDEAMQMMQEQTGYLIVDVRRPDEFAESHIAGAINVPVEAINTVSGAEELADDLPDKDQMLLIYCRSGNRSKEASRKLADMGYTNVYEFGGIDTWEGEVVKGE